MLQQPNSNRKAVSARTIVAAVIMLTGIVMLATGYFRNNTTVIFVGVMVTLAGVMMELVVRIIAPRSGKTR